MRARLLLLPLLLFAACDPGEAPRPAEPFPLTVDVPGVLGYVALGLPEPALRALVEAALGDAPRGLGGGPALLVPMDPSALGGPLAVVLPLANRELFEASLTLMEGVEEVGDGRLRLSVPAGSGLFTAMGLYDTFTAPPSALGVLDTMGPGLAQIMGGGGARDLLVEFVVEDDRALLVPSFEAVSAARRLPSSVSGLAALGEGRIVIDLDLRRVLLAFHGPIQATRQRLLGALSTAGALASRETGVDVDIEQIEARLDALALDEFDAVQLDLQLPTWMTEQRSLFAAPPPDDPGALSHRMRLRWEGGGTIAAHMESWRPVPDLPGAVYLARRDASWWPRGSVSEFVGWWLFPWTGLGERQEDARRLLEVLEQELSAAEGLVAVLPRDAWGVEPFEGVSGGRGNALHTLGENLAFLTLAPATRIDFERIGGVLDEIVHRHDGDLTVPPDARDLFGGAVVTGPDGITRVVGDGGDVILSAGQVGSVAWFGLGDIDADPAEACGAVAAAARERPASGPVAVFRSTSGDGGFTLDVQGDELVFDVVMGREDASADDGESR